MYKNEIAKKKKKRNSIKVMLFTIYGHGQTQYWKCLLWAHN